MTNYHICSLIFLPSNSIVLILKSIPADKKSKIISICHDLSLATIAKDGIMPKAGSGYQRCLTWANRKCFIIDFPFKLIHFSSLVTRHARESSFSQLFCCHQPRNTHILCRKWMNVITKVMNQELIQLQFALTFHQVARMSKVTQTWWFRAGFY